MVLPANGRLCRRGGRGDLAHDPTAPRVQQFAPHVQDCFVLSGLLQQNVPLSTEGQCFRPFSRSSCVKFKALFQRCCLLSALRNRHREPLSATNLIKQRKTTLVSNSPRRLSSSLCPVQLLELGMLGLR
jgi:hypothetical protein